MLNPVFKSPKHLVAEWPEVFEDLYITSLPIKYVETILIEFSNGRVWEFNFASQNHRHLKLNASKIVETFNEHQEEIISLDFKVDVDKLKKDIFEQTKKIF
jgi:hypothetical protein